MWFVCIAIACVRERNILVPVWNARVGKHRVRVVSLSKTVGRRAQRKLGTVNLRSFNDMLELGLAAVKAYSAGKVDEATELAKRQYET